MQTFFDNYLFHILHSAFYIENGRDRNGQRPSVNAECRMMGSAFFIPRSELVSRGGSGRNGLPQGLHHPKYLLMKFQ